MGLFGFGNKEKKNENSEKKEQKSVVLSKREADRYHVKNLYAKGIGKVINISKNGVSIAKEEITDLKKENVDLEIEDIDIRAFLKRETLKEVGLKFENEIDKEDIIKSYLEQPVFYQFDPKNRLGIDEIEDDENIEKVKAVINLMLELDDPTTNVDKFKTHIEALPELEEKIIKKANSVESASKSKIENVTTAITRLGFEEVKSIVYDFINSRISLSNKNFEYFENYEFYNILKSSLFKKLAPLFAFRDLRSEGRSLLTTDVIGLEFLIEKGDKNFKKFYKSPKFLYGYYARIFEKYHFGIDFLYINKDYFVNKLGLFKYLYDGYILAHLNHFPYYELDKNIDILLSSRKLRFSYVVYLTFLALEFILSKDKKSGAVLLNRLKRFGLDSSKAINFLNETIFEANEILENIGIENKINSVSYPTLTINIEKMFGKELHISSFIDKVDLVSKNKIDRAAFRYEDEFFSMYLIDLVLNSFEFNFNDMPFCVIPVENLKDDELKMETFNGFDILIFKNIEKLNKEVWKDFLKLWRDFEGKIFVTYSAYSMIDFNNKELHNLIKNYIIDTPSYFDNDYIYKKMLKTACSDINKELGANICNQSVFEDKIYSMDSIIKRSIESYSK